MTRFVVYWVNFLKYAAPIISHPSNDISKENTPWLVSPSDKWRAKLLAVLQVLCNFQELIWLNSRRKKLNKRNWVDISLFCWPCWDTNAHLPFNQLCNCKAFFVDMIGRKLHRQNKAATICGRFFSTSHFKKKTIDTVARKMPVGKPEAKITSP